jgi:hypothetical protein
MRTTVADAALFALYQFSLLLGIVFLPLALFARRAGVRLPLDRVFRRAKNAYASR